MSLRLRIEHGQDAGKTWRLPRAGVYTLGRTLDASMRVLDMKVSKLHCEIHLSEDGAMLKDLESTHGCMVNAQRVNGAKPLNPGDELRLGMTILRVLSDGEADEEIEPAAGREVSADAANGGADAAPATRQTLAADALVGKDLGGYKLESKIGAGGMGGVYLAEQTSLKRKVALKVLNEKFAADSAFVDQFVNEARAAGALNHPNVVQVYDVGQAEGNYFFSMEVMPGGSIEDRVRERNVEWEEGLNWFIDASNALIFAEKREILHRDVKPDNLMIAEDGSAKLCDLGLAKKSEVKDLMDQGIIGTPHFISPEAIRRKPDIDVRTDLYSLGCSFYRVFTGKNPYPGKSVKEILLGHLNRPVPTINSVNRNVPKELDEIVAKLMAKDVAERFQTPAELLRSLDKVRTKYNLEAHGIKPASRKPLFIGAAAALIAIGVAIWFATRDPEVVREPISKSAKARALAVARNTVKLELAGIVQKAQGDLNALDGRAVGLGGVTKDNFEDPRWPKLVGDYRAAADAWDVIVAGWAKDQAKEKDDVIKGYYVSHSAELTKLSQEARKKAREYDDDVSELKKDKVLIADATRRAKEDLEAKLKDHAKKVQTHFENREFKMVERELRATRLRDIVNPFLKLKFKKYLLLDYEKDVVPLLNRYFPGDAKGLNRGKKTVDAAVKAVDVKSAEEIKAAKALLGDVPDIEQYKNAIERLKTYLKEFPQDLKGDSLEAPRTTAAYRRSRLSVELAVKGLERELEALILERNAADKGVYFKLLKREWAPAAAGGLFNRFDLQAAIDQAELATAVMKTQGYKRLGGEWIEVAKALKGLFDRLHSTFRAGEWTSDNFWYVDDRGRQKKGTIKNVGYEGITWKNEVHSYTELGPAKLLEDFFFVRSKEGERTGPRFACEPADHFGLAILYELAGDYENAALQYRSAEVGLGADPRVAVIKARVGRIPAEREAAAKWIAARDWVAETRKLAERLEALRDSGQFDQKERSALLDIAEELRKKTQDMQTMRYDLLENVRLAGTAWGSCVREAPHPRVAYAGEELPPEGAAPPRKPDKPQDEPKDEPKDGDKPGGKDGGGKKPGGDPEPAKDGGGKGGKDDKGSRPKEGGEKKKQPPDGHIRK